jgi:L-phenylalanine/L-methionine N-acetyltransferase
MIGTEGGAGTVLMQSAVDLADKWLNLTRLELEVYTDNESVIRLYKKFGFTIEGILRSKILDSHLMVRLRQV